MINQVSTIQDNETFYFFIKKVLYHVIPD